MCAILTLLKTVAPWLIKCTLKPFLILRTARISQKNNNDYIIIFFFIN